MKVFDWPVSSICESSVDVSDRNNATVEAPQLRTTFAAIERTATEVNVAKARHFVSPQIGHSNETEHAEEEMRIYMTTNELDV